MTAERQKQNSMASKESLRSLVDDWITEHPFEGEPASLYQPVNYILSLGGKRIRPVMMLMAYELFGGKAKELIEPAVGIELFHNFTLLHDDIMDEADIRRGKETVHKKWDKPTAILAGDSMFILSANLIAKVPDSCLKEALNIFNRNALAVCEGQQFDMLFESQAVVSVDEYLEMIRLKTAVLLAASLEIGALAAGASENDRKHIYHFGIHLGLSFQLMDDLLDTFGDGHKVGKKIGGDILANKKTILLCRAMESAKGADKEALLNQYSSKQNSNPDEKIKAVKALYEKLNVKNYTTALARKHTEKAMHALDQISCNAEYKTELKQLANSLLNRLS